MGKRSRKSNVDSTGPSIPVANAQDVPILSADALNKLSARIQQDFSKSPGENKKGAANAATSTAAGKKEKKPKDKNKSRQNQPLPDQKAAFGSRNHNGNPPPPSKSQVQNKGRQTLPIAGTRPDSRNSKKFEKSAPQNLHHQKRKQDAPRDSLTLPKKAGTNKVDKEALLKEIIELGGSAEDLDLVTGLDSDDELEELVIPEQKEKGKNVKKNDIEAFMKEIGLEAGKIPDAQEEEVEEEWLDEKSDEEADEDMEEEEEEEEGEEDGEEGDENAEMENPSPVAPLKSKDGKQRLMFEPRPDWHAFPLPELSAPTNPPSPQSIAALHQKAKALLTAENELYSATHLVKSSDRQFLSQIMKNGTLSDKISALTLVCQESPLHTTKTLENLLGLARKKSRSQAVQALRAIKDLFAQGVCLPPNRKLKAFNKQPCLGAKGTQDIHLLVWAYEDWLKNFYFEVLKTLESLCADQLEYARKNAVGFVYELLKEKPEQESNLLRMLVNKLGDKDKQVASKVSWLLLQIQVSHPGMKSIVIDAIESEVLFRPGNTAHAKYYAIITLNQTVLSSREHDVANKLLNIYFAIFTALLKKDAKEDVVSSGAAGGKHVKFDDAKQPEKPAKMNKKAKARAAAKEKQSQYEEDINAKLISAVLTGVNRAFPFSKVDDDVFDRHMDTLFRITHSGNFNTGIQALMLIFQVSNSKQAVSDRFYRTLYESLSDQRLVNSSKQALYLNLLFRALKSDTSIKRVKAFVKRILQIASFHQPAFIVGLLYLLSELELVMPAIRSLITDPEPNEDDDEEVFRDAPDSDAEDAAAPAPNTQPPSTANRPKYDGRKRDPLHANADLSCIWELLPFTSHFHPAVALFAQCFLEKRPMPSKPDLGMHSLSHFLDRFVYRNPKAQPATAKGQSIMQPLAGGNTQGMVLATRTGKKAMAPVNSEVFWKQAAENVRPEEVFFHRYFNLTKPAAGKKENKAKKDVEDSEDESGQEEEVWKALVKSNPELDGDDEEADFDDEDLDMDDDDDDSEGGLDLGDLEDDEWDTDDDEEEDADEEDDDDEMEDDAQEPASKKSAAALFENSLSQATRKRNRMADEEDGDDSDGVVATLMNGEVSSTDEKEKKDDKKKKRRKLSGLPTFASAEDYAHMMEDEED